MRIRRPARVSAPPISPSPSTPSTDVCEFNRSSWDVLSEHPQSQLEHQVVLVDNNGGGTESDHAPDSLVPLKKQFREEVVKKMKKEVEEEDEESRLSLMQIVKKKRKKRVNKVKREMDYGKCSLVALKKQSMDEVGKKMKKVVVKEDEGRRLPLVDIVKEKGKKRVNKVKRDMDNYRKCSKNDGKKWHCKNMAKEGYAFCEHHLTKHKFYYDNHTNCRKTKCPPTKCPQTKCPQRSVKKAKVATTSPAEFYYYSGFGPWWGRKRGGNEIQRDELKVVDPANQATSSSSSQLRLKHHRDENDCMPDYFDFDDEESGEEEKKKMSKRRPRPTKARSLKSLL